uniref:dihydroneopterin aldolase n=1 Tax=Castellaniella defragrans TaxID=75697 RepID=UPI0033411296
MKTRRILLQGLRVQARIGVLDHERLAPQTLVFHAAFDIDASRPVDDRDIGTVLDYRDLRAALIAEATRGHVDLLESLVDRCLECILSQFPGVLHAKIRISKPEAFPDCDAVAIEQARGR